LIELASFGRPSIGAVSLWSALTRTLKFFNAWVLGPGNHERNQMIRKLMPVLLAAVALGAFASAAQASTFTAEKYPATISGAQVGEHVFSVESGLTVKCKSATFSGTLSAASSTITMAPVYKECVAFGFVNSTVNFNSCNYLFHAGEEVAADKHAGSVDIVCPKGGPIVITAGTCETQIPAQTGLNTNNIENNTSPKDATASGSLTGITYTKTKDGFGCPFAGTGTRTDGGYSGTATATATSGGVQVGIWVD
jgi:hypothetical protein